MSQEEYRKAAIDAVAKLSQDVGIPASLKDIVKEEDLSFLADSALADACCPSNPKKPSKEDVIALYRSLMQKILWIPNRLVRKRVFYFRFPVSLLKKEGRNVE